MGLLGSTYLAKQLKLHGLSDKVEVLNIDCLASAGNYMTIEGGGPASNKRLESKAIQAADELGINYKTPPKNDRTDAEAFEKAGIPAITFLWAWENDMSNRKHYHQPTDRPEIARYDNLHKSTELICSTAWKLSHS
jgi:Zn-dependent M28 family amino/carboxypeptidase